MNTKGYPLSRRHFMAGTSASAAMLALHPFSALAAANQSHLRVLATTDLHVHVYPYDYYADKPNDTMGLARSATIIREIEAEATNSMRKFRQLIRQSSPGTWRKCTHGLSACRITRTPCLHCSQNTSAGGTFWQYDAKSRATCNSLLQKRTERSYADFDSPTKMPRLAVINKIFPRYRLCSAG